MRIESSPESKEPAFGTQVTDSSEEGRSDITPLFNINSKNRRRLVVIPAEREVNCGGVFNRSKGDQDTSGVMDLLFIPSIKSAFFVQYSPVIKQRGITNRRHQKSKENEKNYGRESGVVHSGVLGVVAPLYQTCRGFEERAHALRATLKSRHGSA